MKNKRDFLRDQLSRYFHPTNPFGSFADDEIAPLRGGIFPSLLIRDVSHHLMPFGSFSSRRNFSIGVQPASKQFEDLLTDALEDRDYHSRSDLRDQVSKFVRLCGTELLGIGTATYEIVFLKERTTSEKKGFLFFYVDPRTLFARHNGTYQYGSADAVRNRSRKGATFLPDDRLLVFHLPAKYRHLRHRKNIVHELDGLNVFRVAETQQKTKDSIYNFKEHHRAEQLALASATRETGWAMGGAVSGTFLEYYEVWRYLVYNRFVIEVRDEILKTLNDTINRISTNFGPEAALVIKGLPSLEDVEKAFQDLESGTRSFVSLIDQFSL